MINIHYTLASDTIADTDIVKLTKFLVNNWNAELAQAFPGEAVNIDLDISENATSGGAVIVDSDVVSIAEIESVMSRPSELWDRYDG